MRSDPPFSGALRARHPRTIYTFRVRALDPQGGSLLTHLSLREGSDSDLIIGCAAKRNCSVFQYGRGGGNLSIVPAILEESDFLLR